MKRKNLDDKTISILLLIRLDAQRLFERIKYRRADYMYVFSAKRTRKHFSDIFKNRYDSLSINDLILCGNEVLASLDSFYYEVDEMRWFLATTEEMPSNVETIVESYIVNIENCYEALQLFIGAEFQIKSEKEEKLYEESFSIKKDEDLIITYNNEDIPVGGEVEYEDNFYCEDLAPSVNKVG